MTGKAVPCSACGKRIVTGPNSSATPTCLDCKRTRHLGYNADRAGVCWGCGSDFIQSRDNITYCSFECIPLRGLRVWEWRSMVTYGSCRSCEGPFVARGKREYCSPKCRAADSHPPFTKVCILPCEGCGEFVVNKRCPRRFCAACRSLREWKARRESKVKYGKARLLAATLVDYIGHRDKWRCHICTRPVSRAKYDRNESMSKTVDHIVPVSQGGSHEPANLRLAHMICNARRGERGGNEQLMLVG